MKAMKVRNKTLYTEVKKFLNASVQTLENLAEKEDLPVRQVTTYKYNKKGYTQEEGYETDFFIYIFKHSNNIEVLPEFQQCAKYLLKNPLTRRALGWKDQKGQPARDLPLKLTYLRLLYVILGEYLRKVGRLAFREDKFNEIYIAFERSVYSQKVLYRVTAPLGGLSGDIDEVSFGNGFKIRRIEDSEKSEYLKLTSEPFPTRLGNLDITEVEYMLETSYSSHMDAGIDTSLCRKGFEDIQTALRLFKPERLGFEVVKTEPVSWTIRGGTSYGWSHSRQGRILPNLYRLDKSDEKRLLKLWRKFRKFRKASGSSIRGKIRRSCTEVVQLWC